jgi:hypothetical protein
MRRALAPVCFVAVAATSCGALADDTAGTVGDRSASVGDVSALTVDALEVDGGEDVGSTDALESVLPGDDARNALLQLMLSEAVAEVVEAAGLEIDRGAAEEQIQASGGSLDQYSERTREVVLTQLGGLTALNEWFTGLDLADEADAQALYDLAPGLWDRRCAVVVSGIDLDEGVVDERVEDGLGLESIDGEVEELEAAADSGQCRSLATLLAMYSGGADPAVIEAIVAAEVGEVVGPIAAEGSSVWIEVTEIQPGDAAAMVEELDAGVVQFDPTLIPVWWLLEDSTVNPRYGTEVQLSEGLSIGRPQAPVPPEPEIELDTGTVPAP